MRYIKSDMVFTLRPPDTITEQGKVYPGKHRYMVPHELDIDETFAQFNLEEPDNPIKVKDYIFVKDKRTPLESSPTHDKPEIEGEYLTYSDAKVYKSKRNSWIIQYKWFILVSDVKHFSFEHPYLNYLWDLKSMKQEGS